MGPRKQKKRSAQITRGFRSRSSDFAAWVEAAPTLVEIPEDLREPLDSEDPDRPEDHADLGGYVREEAADPRREQADSGPEPGRGYGFLRRRVVLELVECCH